MSGQRGCIELNKPASTQEKKSSVANIRGILITVLLLGFGIDFCKSKEGTPSVLLFGVHAPGLQWHTK